MSQLCRSVAVFCATNVFIMSAMDVDVPSHLPAEGTVSASADVGKVQWACLTDGYRWTTYSPEFTVELEQAYLIDQPHCSFKRKRFSYVVDLRMMVQTNMSTGKSRCIRRTPAPNTLGTVQQWEWEDEYGNWNAYDMETCEQLAASLRPQTLLSTGSFFGRRPNIYCVDKTAMIQTNVYTGMPRRLRVVAPPSPVAPTAPACADLAAACTTVPADASAALSTVSATEITTLDAASADDLLSVAGIPYIVYSQEKGASEPERCPICLGDMETDDPDPDMLPIALKNCVGHGFHRGCITPCISQNSLKCPICNVIYGQPMTGTQPKGSMSVSRNKRPLADFQCGTIVINFLFPDGIQEENHPQPGKRYKGTSRRAYLPDNADGNALLDLFRTAWDRKLLFTVGYSTTLGETAGIRVTWNGIHMKTSLHGEHGFPDATYFVRVREELAAVGVTES